MRSERSTLENITPTGDLNLLRTGHSNNYKRVFDTWSHLVDDTSALETRDLAL